MVEEKTRAKIATPGPTNEEEEEIDDCVLLSYLQGASAATAVKVEEIEQDGNQVDEPEAIEQTEEGTGAASSSKRKDTRTGRKRRELNVPTPRPPTLRTPETLK